METEATMTSELTQTDKTKSRILKQAGLGERLRSARETMRLSEKDAAARLHLSHKMIPLMENEDFDNGPPATFIRGYLRSYAHMLNISEAEINATITQLDTHIAHTPITHALPIMKTQSLHNSHRYLRWMTYVVIAVLTVLVSIWWSSHPKDVVTVTKPSVPVSNVASSVNPAPTVAAPISTLNNNVNANPPLQAQSQQNQTASTANTTPSTPAVTITNSPVNPAQNQAPAAPSDTLAESSKAPSNTVDMGMALPEPGLEQNDNSDE